MALAETTLSAACGANDRTIVVASATSISVGRLFRIDGEMMQATKGYDGSSTTVPVIRGQNGTAQVAHVSGARVTHGDAADWGNPGAGVSINFPPAGWARDFITITTTTTWVTADLQAPGTDRIVQLSSASAITFTIPVPTKAMDGCRLTIIGHGTGAAHIVVFTGGLNGAGSSYDTLTGNATPNPFMLDVVAADEKWNVATAPAFTGTVTSLVAGIA